MTGTEQELSMFLLNEYMSDKGGKLEMELKQSGWSRVKEEVRQGRWSRSQNNHYSAPTASDTIQSTWE